MYNNPLMSMRVIENPIMYPVVDRRQRNTLGWGRSYLVI